MADLGFLPAVRRLLDQTPRNSQRLLFSATLDKAIDVLVKRFLNQPVTHEADSAQSPISTMDHHVLHIGREHRVPVLVDLASAPGRTVVFTRTKHGAKALTRQLNRSGVPTRRAARQPQPERPHPQHGGVPLRQGRDPGRHRHRRSRHPRRRRRAGHPRRPAGRAQGLPAPLRPYGAGRGRGHRHHADDRRAGARRPLADPRRRHQADDHEDRRVDHPMLAQLAPGERVVVPGGIVVEAPAAGRSSSRPTGSRRWRPQPLASGGRGGQGGPATGAATGPAAATANGNGGNRNGNRSEAAPVRPSPAPPGGGQPQRASFSSGRR